MCSGTRGLTNTQPPTMHVQPPVEAYLLPLRGQATELCPRRPSHHEERQQFGSHSWVQVVDLNQHVAMLLTMPFLVLPTLDQDVDTWNRS